MRLVMIDNYDSFTYNLVQLFYEFDLEVLVFRHDEIDLAGIAALKPHWLCISPGPKAPDQAGHQQSGHRPFLPTNSHPGSLPGTPGPERSLRRRHRQGPHPGARQTPPGFSYGAGRLQRSAFTLRGRPLPLPHGRAPLPGTGSHRLDRGRRHHGPPTPPIPPPRGPVPPGILSHQPRPRPGREFFGSEEVVGGRG